MANKSADRIEVQWTTHQDPKKVGTKEQLSPREAHAAVRTGLAAYVSEKDVPPARPSMNTRSAALQKAEEKDGGEPAPATAGQSAIAADTDADAAALDAAVSASDSATSITKAARKR